MYVRVSTACRLCDQNVVVGCEKGERESVAAELRGGDLVGEEGDAGADDERVARDGEQLEHHDVRPLDDKERDHCEEQWKRTGKGEMCCVVAWRELHAWCCAYR